MRHALSAGGVPPASAVAAWDSSAVITSAARMDGLTYGYTHAAHEMPLPYAPIPPRSSAFQETLVQHSGWKGIAQINPTFYPRNLGLSFKVERQIDRSANPYADQPQQVPAPQWRRALQYPRAVITPPTYPIVQG